jgi:hypothetical protein
MLSLLALDRRKPVRHHSVAPRAPGGRAPAVQVVEHGPAQPYRRTPAWRRLLALVGLGSIGVIGGILVAIVLGTLAVATVLFLSNAVAS